MAFFRKNIVSRAAWAKANSVAYAHMIFPDKQSIIPESWPIGTPIKLGERYLDRCSDLDLPILYPTELLAEHKAETTSKTDTHITAYGSILVAAHIVEHLTGESQREVLDQLLGTIDSQEERDGDLGSKLQPPARAIEKVSSARAPGIWLHNNLQGGNNGLIDLRFCKEPRYNKRFLMFGDSFGREMARYLQFWFREVVFLRSGYFDPDIANLLQPDFLLTENVERYLDSCASDDERPNFFMYPFIGGSPYCPSIEFAQAFSAMLSVPRAPYRRFHREQFGREFEVIGQESTHELPEVFISGSLRLIDDMAVSEDRTEIEELEVVARHMPDFFVNLSGKDLINSLAPLQDIHSSNLVTRRDVLLIGPNLLVDERGRWACESRAFRQQFLDLVRSPSFQSSFPGPKPRIWTDMTVDNLDFDAIDRSEIELVAEPVFLATPLEPANWGRWIVTALPKLHQFRKYGEGRKLFCYSSLRWQRDLLARFEFNEIDTLNHDPGRAYFCSDVMTVDYNVANITVSRMERAIFADIREESLRRLAKRDNRANCHDRVFISRMDMAARHPTYRVLENERELADGLTGLSFQVLQPELLSFDEQVASFANAKIVVCLGGAALYNAVFCRPGTKVITIESSGMFLSPHCNLLSSLGLEYGVIVGVQNETDPTPVHKRWTVDVAAACEQVRRFM